MKIINMSSSALFIFHEGLEELEAIAPLDILRRAGVECTTASTGAQLEVTGKNNICVKADRMFEDIVRTIPVPRTWGRWKYLVSFVVSSVLCMLLRTLWMHAFPEFRWDQMAALLFKPSSAASVSPEHQRARAMFDSFMDENDES